MFTYVIPILNNNKTNEKECFLPITGGLSEFIVCPICLPNNEVWYKMETLEEAYKLTKKSNGAPGIDKVTFESIEAEGLEKYLQQIRRELITKTYSPNRNRRKEIPKAGGMFKKVCQTAFLVQLNFQSAGKEDIKLRHS